MDIKTVIIQNAEIEYTEFGSGTKPFVILPGMGLKSSLEMSDSIAKQYSPVAENFRFFLIERKNNITENYSVEQMAEDTAEALMKLNISNCCLFGASQGGMVALEIAKRYPLLVKKLIICSSRLAPIEDSDKVFLRWKKYSADGETEKLVSAFCDEVYSEDFNKKHKSAVIEMYKNTTKYELDRFAILSDACLNYDGTAGTDKITCPVLVLGAGNDKVMTENAAPFLASHLTNCKTVIYKNGSHAIYDEEPNVLSRISAFSKDN